MEGANNGVLLYHERQESKLCALHCVNTLLQGPYFSVVELAAHASDLDHRERQMMMLPSQSAAYGYFSHNVALDGNFSIQVIQKALEVWDLQVIPLDSPVAEPAKMDPDLESAYIFHPENHWFSVRKVSGEWYNFNSACAAPERITKSCLFDHLNYWICPGRSIFVVRGNFPTVFPMSSSEDSTGFGKWFSPEDAERTIYESRNRNRNPVQQAPPENVVETQQNPTQFQSDEEDEMFSDCEDEDYIADYNAAVAASLMDSSLVVTNAEANAPQNDDKQKSIQVETIEASLPPSDE